MPRDIQTRLYVVTLMVVLFGLALGSAMLFAVGK